MLQDQELALAVNAAFSYIPPDETLKQAVLQGRMKTREDVKREVDAILAGRQHPQAACAAVLPRVF